MSTSYYCVSCSHEMGHIVLVLTCKCHLLLSGYSIFKSFMTDMRPIFDLYSECILYKMYE